MTPFHTFSWIFFSYLIIIPFITGKKHSHDHELLLESSEIFPADSGYYQSDAAYSSNNGATGSVLPVNHPIQQKCVDIPQNMSLCQGIGYGQMLIPNLMEHETVREANEQSQTWMPLANIKCHQHTRLFLCSLFAPICPMQQPQPGDVLGDQGVISTLSGPVIYPCRSLCESVKHGCQGVMSKHGFPWPDMLSCSRFPVDNDMCISPNPTPSGPNNGEFSAPMDVKSTAAPITTPTTTKLPRTRRPSAGHRFTKMLLTTTTTLRTTIPTTPFIEPTTPAFTNLVPEMETCRACTFIVPPSQLDAAFCQAEFVAKVRFRRFTRRGVFLVKKPKIVKLLPGKQSSSSNHTILLEDQLRNAKSVEFFFQPEKMTNTCRHLCAEKVELRSQVYMVMGVLVNNTISGRANHHLSSSRLPQIGMQLLLPWFTGLNSRDFRQAEKRLQNLKCTSPLRPETQNNNHRSQLKPQRSKKPRGI